MIRTRKLRSVWQIGMRRALPLFILTGVASACDGSFSSPEPLPDPRPEFVEVAAGRQTACALTSQRDVYCWGWLYGSQPQLVPGEHEFASITAGESGQTDVFGFHACGVTVDGIALCWGQNGWGELGDGEQLDDWEPNPVTVLTDLHFEQVAAGKSNTCGLVEDGSIHCWGENGEGHLGTPPGQVTLPEQLPTDLRFRQLASGRRFKCAITEEDETYCWGDDDYGQLGDGDYEAPIVNPVPQLVLGTPAFRLLASGYEHTCGISSEGGIAYCWGRNHVRQLNDGTSADRDSAVIANGGLPSFVYADAGGNGTCGVTRDGDVHCWGSVCTHSEVPVKIDGVPPLVSVSVGLDYACGISHDAWVHCWGWNRWGALGRSDDAQSVEGGCRSAGPIEAPKSQA